MIGVSVFVGACNPGAIERVDQPKAPHEHPDAVHLGEEHDFRILAASPAEIIVVPGEDDTVWVSITSEGVMYLGPNSEQFLALSPRPVRLTQTEYTEILKKIDGMVHEVEARAAMGSSPQ